MKLCECGCGLPAPLARQNHTKRGYVNGQPMRFVRGHSQKVIRGGVWTPARRKGMSQRLLGKKIPREWIAKRVATVTGRVYGPEHRQAISDSLRGLNRGPSHWHWAGGDPRDPKRHTILNAARHNRRKIRKVNGGGSFTTKEWLALKRKFKNTCPACGRCEPDIKLTHDHIIPVSRGGSGSIDNIQPLCGPCNSRKHILVMKFSNNGQLMFVM